MIGTPQPVIDRVLAAMRSHEREFTEAPLVLVLVSNSREATEALELIATGFAPARRVGNIVRCGPARVAYAAANAEHVRGLRVPIVWEIDACRDTFDSARMAWTHDGPWIQGRP